MKRKIIQSLPAAVIIITSLIIVTGCGSISKIQSDWNSSEVKIDGETSEWQNTAFFVKDEHVSLNFKNDDKFLYLCMMMNDRGKIMQLMRSGFMIWFYPENGNSRIFGIKYPMPPSALGSEDREELNKESFRPDDLKDRFAKRLSEANEFQILNEDNFPLGQLPIDNNEGIKVKISYSNDRFVYELQVPIKSENNFSYNIGTLPGEKIKIKFETLESEFARQTGDRTGRGDRSRSSDEDLSETQGRMRRSEGMNFPRSSPFNYEVELTLQKQN